MMFNCAVIRCEGGATRLRPNSWLHTTTLLVRFATQDITHPWADFPCSGIPTQENSFRTGTETACGVGNISWKYFQRCGCGFGMAPFLLSGNRAKESPTGASSANRPWDVGATAPSPPMTVRKYNPMVEPSVSKATYPHFSKCTFCIRFTFEVHLSTTKSL